MTKQTQAAAASNAARSATRSVANNNPEPSILVEDMNAEQRKALMAQLRLAQQAYVAPLEKRKRELEAELEELNDQIQAIKPGNDSLAVFRAVRKAVKNCNTTLEDIVATAGYDTATVEAMLNKHLLGKDGHGPIFILEDGEYCLAPKA